MNNLYEIKLKNTYHFELYDTINDEVTQVFDCPNVITKTTTDYMKINRFMGWNFLRCQLGTGVGTPAVTDTALFTFLGTAQQTGNVAVGSGYPNVSRKLSYTVPAAECIGILTEFGLWHKLDYYDAGRLMTHALFVDSEGNPITINKTATDILYITVTMTYTIGTSACAGKNESIFLDESPTGIYAALTSALLDTGYSFKSIPTSIHASAYKMELGALVDRAMQIISPVIGSLSMTQDFSGNFSATGLSLPYSSVPTYGGPLGYSIKALIIKPFGIINITPEIFPPKPFPKYQVGVGDGATTDFYIKTQNAVLGSQKVYVDGVLQTSDVDYTFYENNAKDFWGELIGANSTYCTSMGKSVSNRWYFGPWYPSISNPSDALGLYIEGTKPLCYDFLSPKEVNAVKIGALYGYTNLELQYSSDNTNWTTVFTLGAAMANSIQYFTKVTARYWRWHSSAYQQSGNYIDQAYYLAADPMANACAFAFGLIKPNIIFATPPAASKVIEIEYDIPYPFHNSLNSVTFDVAGQLQV